MKNFTTKGIDSLKPKKSRYEVREKDGFLVRVTPNGSKAWIFTYDFEGKRRRMTLGNCAYITLKEARSLHLQARITLENGTDPGADKIGKRHQNRTAPSVKDLVDDYLNHYWFSNLAASSQVSYKDTLTKKLIPEVGHIKVKDIKRIHIQRILDQIIKRKKRVQAKRSKAHIQRLFNFAIEQDYIQYNPITAIRLNVKTPPRTRYLNEEEIKTFWFGLEDSKLSKMYREALRFQLITGQRKGEICKARWDAVDWEACTWTIPKEIAKNRTKHVVRLSTLAIEVLLNLQAITGKTKFFLPSPLNFNKHIIPNSLDQAFHADFASMGIDEAFTPHDLRRTTASHMERLHIPIDYIKRILNHSLNRGVTGTYTYYDAHEEVQEAMEIWSSRLREILGIPAAPACNADPKIIQLHQPPKAFVTGGIASHSN